jgi:hypothetical protein
VAFGLPDFHSTSRCIMHIALINELDIVSHPSGESAGSNKEARVRS